MKANKLTIEEQFLTLDQAKELQALGIDFSGANFGIYNFYESLNDDEVTEIRPIDKIINDKLVTPTLSVAEMISILPKKITHGKDYYYPQIYILENGYGIRYDSISYGILLEGAIDTMASLLRDALFEMIKLLKQNKFI